MIKHQNTSDKMIDLRTSRFLKIPRKIVKNMLGLLYYPIIWIYGKPIVKSLDETVDEIISNNCSIGRFGDGEISILLDKVSYPFQSYNSELVKIYKEILKSKDIRYLVGLPVGYYSLDNLDYSSSLMWRAHIAFTLPRLKKKLLIGKIYYNANITRPYIGRKNIESVGPFFEKLKSIWKNRKVLLVEGEKSRLGVGNDLFRETILLERILAPASNAYDKKDELMKFISKYDKTFLILLALGPTATALSFLLHKNGFQALDIGNVDLEYEWFRTGTKKKTKIMGKYVSEVKGGNIVEDVNDDLYFKQIVACIL